MKKIILTIVCIVVLLAGNQVLGQSETNSLNEQLLISARSWDTDVVSLALQKGADIEARDSDGRTSLILAVEGGRPEVVKLLLQKGANVEAKDKDNLTALLSVFFVDENKQQYPNQTDMEADQAEIVKLLLEKGANINAKTKEGKTALQLAVEKNNPEIVRLLQIKSTRVEGIDKMLINAARMGHVDTVKLLLAKDADVNAKDDSGNTVLQWAVIGSPYKEDEEEESRVEVVDFLLAKGAKIEVGGKGGQTPLMRASGDGEEKLVDLLLSKGAEIESKDDRGDTALMHAAFSGQLNTMKTLLAKNASVENKNNNGETALIQAVGGDCLECVKLLLSKGGNVHDIDKHGRTVLHWAMIGDGSDASEESRGDPDLVRMLIVNGVDVNSKDDSGHTALREAILHKRTKVIKLLQEKGAR
jgi:ankyrin repeat protein